MNLLTQDQVKQLCLKVGFSEKNARIGSAIALCEAPATKNGIHYSDFDMIGDQDLANETWGYSYGGFQVRSLRSELDTGKIRDAARLHDPEFNARSARAIKLDAGWGAWTTYTNGQFKAYLQDLYPPPPGVYIVLSGDTLSKVAAKVDMPWQQLARLNNMHSPYTIF